MPEIEDCSNSKRRILSGIVAGIGGCWVPQVHLPCPHNALDALVRRSLGAVPGPTELGPFEDSFRKIRRHCRKYTSGAWTLEETASSYSGALGRRYQEAARSLLEDGLCPADWKLKCFVKAEKLNVVGKPSKPRLIFPRSPRYNLALARFLKPFEHWLWGTLKGIGQRGVRRSRVVGKGLNPVRRANLIARKMGEFADPVVMEVDGKAFEAHVGVRSVELEHSCYMAAYRGDPELRFLLGKQRTAGVAPGGIRFSRPGGRASGDFNTGMGNSMVMLATVDCSMGSIGCRYDTIVDGDNALLFVERSDIARVLANFEQLALRYAGQEMVLERPVSTLEEVCFGQSNPINLGNELRMVRNWKKVISGATASHNHMHHFGEVHRFLLGVALCEYTLAKGVPILGRYFFQLQADCRRVAAAPLDASHYRDYEVLGVRVKDALAREPEWTEPSNVARVSFCKAFGEEPDFQRAIEQEIPRLRMGGLPLVLPGLDFDSKDDLPQAVYW